MIYDPNKPIFILVLNPMQGNTENRCIVAWSHSKEALEAFCAAETVEPYRDDGPDAFERGASKSYYKTYRKGGPLEWFNRHDDPIYCGENHDQGGIIEQLPLATIRAQAADAAEMRYDNWLNQGQYISG